MLKHIYKLDIEIEVLTGLFIGGTDTGFDIGGADSNVIRNALTNEPYIPGSSLKGKLKTLLKYRDGHKVKIGKDKYDIVFNIEDETRIFEPCKDDGTSESINTTRAIFRDLFLTEKSKEYLESKLGIGNYTELKAENSIDIFKGTAANPRFIERVPAGAVFAGEIVLNVFDGDKEELMKSKIKEGLELLENNYLGGSGTRGYGKVKVTYPEGDFVEVNLDTTEGNR